MEAGSCSVCIMIAPGSFCRSQKLHVPPDDLHRSQFLGSTGRNHPREPVIASDILARISHERCLVHRLCRASVIPESNCLR